MGLLGWLAGLGGLGRERPSERPLKARETPRDDFKQAIVAC